MTGALDPAHVVDDVAGVWLRRSGVTADTSVIDRHNSARLAGYCHLSLREAGAVDEEPRVARGAADRRRDRIDHGQNHKTTAELIWYGDDGAAKVVDSDGYGVSDTDGKFTLAAELAVDLRVRAVDHMTGLIAHCHLSDTETPVSVTTLYKHSLFI